MSSAYNPLGDFELDVEDDAEAQDEEAREDPEAGEGESPDDSQEAEGEKPQTQDSNRVAELQRKLRETENSLLNAVAENAALKHGQNNGAPREEGPKRYTVEQFRELAEKDDGAHLFDAVAGLAKQYADDAVETAKGLQVQQSENSIIGETIESILPGWNDPSTDTYKAIALEKQRLVAKGIRDDTKAQEAAMFKVAARLRAEPKRETKEELGRRRAIENAGGEGAPTRGERGGGGGDEEVTDKMSRADLEEARRLGVKSVFHPDPKVRSHERKKFNARKKNYATRRIG